MRVGVFLAGVSAFSALAGAPALAQDKPFAGVTVNVITQTGAIQEPLQRRAPEFEALTGAKINVIAVPFSDLYQKILTDWASGTNSVDAGVFAPQWMVDYIAGGYLEDLTPRIEADKDIQQDDVGAFFRDFSEKYSGKTYMVTLDGDFHMMYYRKDVLEAAGLAVPKTWDEYLEVAKATHGKDMSGDGTPDFGSCIAKKRNAQSYWFVTDVVGSMTQSKGTSQGTFFNTKDMTPLVNNDAFRKALDFLSESTKYGPPDELNLDVSDTRPLFASGRCALNLDWGDVGTISIDPAQSKVMGKWGAAIMPGSREVLNWDTGKLEACTADNCPHAIDGVNHAPFAAFGGWGGGINAAADPKVKDAAYAYFSFMTQPAQSNADVTVGGTGFNPYRTSQLSYSDLWKKAGMSEDEAKVYLGAINDSMSSPNMILDLRIPQNQKYQQVVLDEAVSRFLAGEIDKEATVSAVEEGWNELNDEVGKDEQLELYKATIGAK
ncbi:ABC transporter substrate-binding protein [Mesorhizobium sp.]|uniref:ABC transporter substrate-binding protein n=1 Tax=Mesorhizobium sp. TaxID=1871066 RepID=UPI00121C5AD6|nr:extracellular solute-binding protein [Mesorhizobium sp.]TIP14978.1 MAG: extracellular solute-binding protein [Mesorhizobium sp.]